MTFDIERARFNMVEQQIRTWEVLDPDVLELLFTVKREDFVPPAHRALAFADLELPLGDGQAMWSPKMEARVLQELALTAGRARARDRHRQRLFHRAARGTRRARDERGDRSAGARPMRARSSRGRASAGVTVEVGDGARGYGRDHYDVIVLTGSTPLLPDAFAAQLEPGGRLFAVVGEAPVMTARLVAGPRRERRSSTDLFETVVPPLINAPQPARFTF